MMIARYRFSLVRSIAVLILLCALLHGCHGPDACAGEIRFRHHLRIGGKKHWISHHGRTNFRHRRGG